MQTRITADDFGCFAILIGLTVLVGLDPASDPFFSATAVGTALMALAALFCPRLRQQFLLLGFLLPISLIATTAANHLVVHLSPHTIDARLSYLGFGTGARAYHWTLRHRFCHDVLSAVYYGLPLFGAFVLLVSLRRLSYAAAWVVAAIPAPLCFLAFPARGPAHVIDPLALRNCVPSLHLTWALLGAVYIGPRWRWLAIAFTVLTAAATLGMGEHYLIDLLVAIPYTWGVCLAVRRSRGFLNKLLPADTPLRGNPAPAMPPAQEMAG